jgi:hypothetical protein
VQLHRSLDEVEREDRKRHDRDERAAPERDRAVPELAPRLARGDERALEREARRRLNQHVGLAAGDAGVVRRPRLDLAPHRGVVARLGELPLLLFFYLIGGLRPSRGEEREEEENGKKSIH